MPSKPARICNCGYRVPSGKQCRCQREKAAARRSAHDATRPSSTERGYDADWRKVRKQFLAANPICCVPGCGARATEADHMQSVRERPDLRLQWTNMRAMCKTHHSRRTAREQGFARRS